MRFLFVENRRLKKESLILILFSEFQKNIFLFLDFFTNKKKKIPPPPLPKFL
jgi:hypothetical protein